MGTKRLQSTTNAAFHIPVDRRRFFKSMAIASAGFMLPGYMAEALTLSPRVTQGPFYPLAKNIPLDKDNDLVHLNDSLTNAKGAITYISGRVLDNKGEPIKNALVELWHADDGGQYLYSDYSSRNSAADKNFAGFGQFLTDSTGRYKFRTIKAGLYMGRTRHFHFGVTVPGKLTRFTTQTFWNEVPINPATGRAWGTTNGNDMELMGIRDPEQRASVILNYTPVPGTTTGEVEANYDFVMGFTPVQPSYPGGGSLVTKGETVNGPSGDERFKISFPAFTGYSYEVYANPTMADLAWGALPFSLNQEGPIDRNIYTATSEKTLDLYIKEKSAKSHYYVAFRVPGSNKGTP